MEEIILDVQAREEVGSKKIRSVRGNNLIPAIVYGERKKSMAVKVDRKIFERLERQHKGGNVILKLKVMEGDKKIADYVTLIKEVQRHPVTSRILHIDFHSISLTREIEVKVPIVAKGEPVGVKQEGGALDHLLWELSVICLPTNIPHAIEADVSNLKLKESIYVKDLKLPDGVKTKQDPEIIVFTVVPPMKELPPEELGGEKPPEELEVIKEKKKEEGEAPAGKEGKEKKEEAPAAKKAAEGSGKPEGK